MVLVAIMVRTPKRLKSERFCSDFRQKFMSEIQTNGPNEWSKLNDFCSVLYISVIIKSLNRTIEQTERLKSERLGMGDHFVRILTLSEIQTFGFRHSTVDYRNIQNILQVRWQKFVSRSTLTFVLCFQFKNNYFANKRATA